MRNPRFRLSPYPSGIGGGLGRKTVARRSLFGVWRLISNAVTGAHSRCTVGVFREISVSGRCSENERVRKGYCISMEHYMEPCC